MAIILTNGIRYIALTNSGAVKKVDDIKNVPDIISSIQI